MLKFFIAKGVYFGHGCPQAITPLDTPAQTSNKDKRIQDISETKEQGELNVEVTETQEHQEMPGGFEIPMDDTDMSLEGKEFVILDTENSKEISLEGVEFIKIETGMTKGDFHTPVPNQSTETHENRLTQTLLMNRQISLDKRDNKQTQIY